MLPTEDVFVLAILVSTTGVVAWASTKMPTVTGTLFVLILAIIVLCAFLVSR